MAKNTQKIAVKKAGRPALPVGQKRQFRAWLPISPEERTLFESAAARAGQPLALWAREALLRAAAE